MKYPVYDFLDRRIEPGAEIVYASRRGSSLWMTHAVVIEVYAEDRHGWPEHETVNIQITVRPTAGGRPRKLRSNTNIVVLKGADHETHCSCSPLESQEKGRRRNSRRRGQQLGGPEKGRCEEE